MSNVGPRMSALIAVAYVSSAYARLTTAELDALLIDARTHNAEMQVTGALLYHDGSFFQYFEGPSVGVENVYARIRDSRLHHGLVELLRCTTPSRRFDAWHMGFAHAPRSFLLDLAQASWLNALPGFANDTSEVEGVQMLLQFWRIAKLSL
jgi:hypothetical protein